METVSIEDLRKIVNDIALAQAARDAERDKRDAESKAEYEKRLKEYRQDYEKRMKQLDRDMGRLGRSYGEQIEAMFVNLADKFNVLGYSFPKEVEGRVRFRDESGKILAEVDYFMENGNVMMAVEIKSKLKIDDVDAHIKRLGIISEHNKKHNDNRKVLGAVAGGIVPENVKLYAQNKGLYVLMQNGESVEIAGMPEGFKPKVW